MKVESITVSGLQFASAMCVIVAAAAGGAGWATKVSVQLDTIQKEVSEIKAELKDLKATDGAHERHLDRLDGQCCPKRTGQVFKTEMPAIISEQRMRVKCYASQAVPTGGWI